MTKGLSVFITFAVVTFLSGCGDSSSPAESAPTVRASPDEAVRDCIAGSSERLRKAAEDGTLVEVSKNIVETLDMYEDSIHGPKSKPFEKFHVAVDQFGRLLESGTPEDVSAQISECESLAAEYLKLAETASETD